MEDEERLLPTGEEEEKEKEEENREGKGGEQIRTRAKWKNVLISYYGASHDNYC